MLLGSALFLCFFGLAFWVLLFLMGFIGVWSHWGIMAMIKAKMAERGYPTEG